MLGQLDAFLLGERTFRLPVGTAPDLEAIQQPNHYDSIAQLGVVAQKCRQENSPQSIGCRVRRAGEQEALQASDVRVHERKLRQLLGNHLPIFQRPNKQAFVESPSDDETTGKGGAELRGDGESPLVVERVLELA